MCGISGVFADDRSADVEAVARRLRDALSHRGPDAAGERLLLGRSGALGHRRLSIVDLECGAQPMGNEDGSLWVVFNGEIYNHLDLRRQLERAGHQFRTRADTEVLVHGWEEWGPELLPLLNGIYAFAVWDERGGAAEPLLWLARDPLGVKPLYVGRAPGLRWFASELGAARAAGLVQSALSSQGLAEYLVYHFVPSPGTMYQDAWKVPPGHYCRLPSSANATPEFRRAKAGFSPASIPHGRRAWRAALRDGLSAAVHRQLMADVPIASLLSGGVDSTVVTRLMRDGLSQGPVAYSIGFAGSAGVNELEPAARAARALGVAQITVSAGETDYLEAWRRQSSALGEPIANPGMLLVGRLCSTVSERFKVVLTGQGADEPLGGYPRHATERYRRLGSLLAPGLRRLPEGLLSSDRVRRLQRTARTLEESRRFAELFAVFSPSEAEQLVPAAAGADSLVDPVRRWLPEEDDGDSVNRLLYVDARLSLADDLLIVADHMSMASSVELRVPFLDLEFMGLVERMPSRYKVSRLGERKWLYRQAVAPLVPAELRGSLLGWRGRVGRKLGFTTPLNAWFSAWGAASAEEFLLGPDSHAPAWLRPEPLRQLLQDVRVLGAPRARQLSSLFVLEAWLRGSTS
ncbi:MAG TPA: asparagine synthase (glutamine-hydrolyzing) [Gemmatimonadales bacterium]|jgi:asparagine synthase (glutamine-hydrolysing)|nr:asparagine synthase (glutamine-hydrolyzing) [Gemmatimonadales bacterium]